MQGMAYADRKWLICLDGGQYVQATELLYHVLLFADGETDLEGIAGRVTAQTGRVVSAEEIRWLVLNKLAGSGLLEWPPPSGETPPAGGADAAGGIRAPAQILAIKHRVPLLPYSVTAPVTAILQHLYWPPLIVLVVMAAAAINVWIIRGADFVNGVITLLFNPELVLLLFALDTVTRVFHELGHASALRRAGARHGVIGFALYVIFPVYFTDVTHAYRLSRAQRIRVDLGGIYFDLISMIGLYVAYRFTGYLPLLVMITLIGLGILRQFTPFMRFDGYYLIADLMGVPEPMSLVVPFVRDHLPWRRGKPKALPHLHPLAVAIMTGYLVLIVAFLSRPLLLMGVAGGAVLEQLPRSGLQVAVQFVFAWRDHDVLTQVAATLELVFWMLIPLGLGLFAFSLLRLLARGLILGARLAASGAGALFAGGPAAPARPAVAPAPVAPPSAVRPTPLDGLGRPVTQPERAAVEDVLGRLSSSPDPAAQELADDLARTYGRRLDSMAAEMERMATWAEEVERERDRLRREVQVLNATVADLSSQLRRIGGELLGAARMAERTLVDETDGGHEGEAQAQ